MYKDFYHTPKAEITPLKIMVAMITVLVFFVIPAQLITFLKNNPNELDRFVSTITNRTYVPDIDTANRNNATGRVAGTATPNATTPTLSVSDEKDNNILSSFLSNINLQDESTRYSALGIGMVLVSTSILIFLIATDKNKNRNNEFESQYFDSNWL